MLLRNKKTGEIVDFMIHKYAELSDDGNPVYAPFNGSIEEWEDYEEPKDNIYWYIDTYNGQIDFINKSKGDYVDREIGNYFESREEAEKAVEKLKALKRLKDKDFDIFKCAVVDSFFCLDIYLRGKEYEKLKDDLKIVFGGVE